MLRRAVQKRPYDWEPLLPAVLQAYRSTPSEATGYTPHFLAFGSEMRLPVELGSPLPEPPRDIRSYGNLLAENFEWAYRVDREVSDFQCPCRDALQSAAHREALPSRRSCARHASWSCSRRPLETRTKVFYLCEVISVRGVLLTLRKLNTRRVFTANHDAVRKSTLSHTTRPSQLPAVAPESDISQLWGPPL